MKKNAFTLIELLAVIVILTIILAIAIPSIIGVIDSSTKESFKSDAQMVLKAIDYKELENGNFNPITINKDNINDLLGLSGANYSSINIIVENQIPIITLVGINKWNGLIACGTFNNMRVVASTTECSTDVVPPVLTVLGDNPTNIFIGETYSDAGVAAEDDKDGDITGSVITTGSINPNVPGSYIIIYTATDTVGNASSAQRTVNVIDNTGPSITLSMNGNINYSQSRTTNIDVTDLGGIDNESLKYAWSESSIEPLADLFTFTYTNNQSISTLTVSGSYYLWLKASDISGNTTTLKSNVFNLDNEKPIININGQSNVSINIGSTYIDAGAIATDNIDASLSVSTTGTVNPNAIGSYLITYNAQDSSGNIAISVTRTVNVIDVSSPIITILGSNPITINIGTIYSDAGATAIDDVDGDVTSEIITTGTVNVNAIGTYNITYTITDTAGNIANATRTVNVIDNILPTIIFGTNGNTTYAKMRSTTVTVSDNVSVDNSSLKYLWNTSTSTPTEISFTATFTNGTTLSSPAGVTGGYYLWILGKDTSGNVAITRTNIFNLDNNSPTITTTINSNISLPYSTWSLTGGAYINASNQLVLPSIGSRATSPYLQVNGTYWTFGSNIYEVNPSPSQPPNGSIYITSQYFNSSYQSSYSTNGYNANGYAPDIPLNQTSLISWDGWTGCGPDVMYVILTLEADNYYGAPPITLSNPSLIASGNSNYQKIINVTTSDVSGIKTKKWLPGSKTIADFTSAGTVFTNSFNVSTNGIYSIYVEDNSGNMIVNQVTITGIS